MFSYFKEYYFTADYTVYKVKMDYVNTVFIVTQCRKKKLPKSLRLFSLDIGHANKICNAVSSNFSVTKSKMRFIVSGKKTKTSFVTDLNNISTLLPIWKTNLWTTNTKRIYLPKQQWNTSKSKHSHVFIHSSFSVY